VDNFKEKVKIKDLNGEKCGIIKTSLYYIIAVASIILVLVGLTLILLYVISS
jgi:hypothetical protein